MPGGADLRAQLQAALGAAYAIERELGGGGMSRVFLATETGLTRSVVVKILTPELAAEVSAERFAREVKLAARLQQANIVPLLNAGNANGLPWYSMPFVRGESLRAKLSSGTPVPVTDAVHILRDVARALAFAHGEGVAHRDIKPENILISGGAAVVTDFGIAKALTTARTQDGAAASPTITQMGASIGTPAYMAPEQVAGDPNVDHRADIYSWGVVAWELLGGKHPFAGKTTRAGDARRALERNAGRAHVDPPRRSSGALGVGLALSREGSGKAAAVGERAAHVARPDRIDERLRGGDGRAQATLSIRALVIGAAIARRHRQPAPGWSRIDRPRRRVTAARQVARRPSLCVRRRRHGEPYFAEGMADELTTELAKVAGPATRRHELGGCVPQQDRRRARSRQGAQRRHGACKERCAARARGCE